MMSARSTVPWVGFLLLTCMALTVDVASAAAPSNNGGHLFSKINRIPSSVASIPTSSSRLHKKLLMFRGGDSDEYDDDDYDSEYDSDEEEEDEPIVTTAKKLATSTKSATQKKAAVKTAAMKSKVSVAMASSSSKAAVATKKRGIYKRFVPYIVRACLNPFTLVAMTKAYFVSLMDINYLKEEPSQNLRSALEEKARKQQPGPTKPKRKMKPGQAKTLSDLPQLSA